MRAEFAAVRDYPHGTLAAHLLGYLGPISPEETEQPEYDGVAATALVGRAGVEATYDADLRGRDGVTELLVDRVGAVAGDAGHDTAGPRRHPRAVDRRERAARRRAGAAARHRAGPHACGARGSGRPLEADSGSVVVMEAKTGRVVAMASYPSYDPSVFVGGASPAEYAELVDEERGAPLVFRAIQGAYAPASTFKVVSTVGGGARAATTRCAGATRAPASYGPTGQRNFDSAALGHDRPAPGAGEVLRHDLLQVRLRGLAARRRQRPGRRSRRTRWCAWRRPFGLGERTGVDLPSERRGTIADRAYKQRLWEQTRDNRCKGAANPELSRAAPAGQPRSTARTATASAAVTRRTSRSGRATRW